MTVRFDVNKRWMPEFPQVRSDPVPVEPCISPEYFELERERVFKRVWLNVGRVEQIPTAGAYFVKDIAVCHDSVIVVRGEDGVVRGFHNICSHRGNKVVWDDCGHARHWACKFHGWTYDNQGQLTGVPDEAMFNDFDKHEHGLVPVATDIWEGFIFVHLGPEPGETLREFLSGFADKHSGYPFHEMTLWYNYRAELKCNWKVALDAFCEGYHVAFVHKHSNVDLFYNQENPLCHPVEFDIWKRHRSFSVFGNAGYTPNPIQNAAMKWTKPAYRAGDEQLPPGVNPNKVENWGFDSPALFPNTVVIMLSDSYLTHHFWPTSVDSCIWEGRMHLQPAATPAEAFAREFSKCLGRDIWMEDTGTMEATHAALKSRVKTHFVLQDGEILIRHFYQVLDEYMTGSTDPSQSGSAS